MNRKTVLFHIGKCVKLGCNLPPFLLDMYAVHMKRDARMGKDDGPALA